MGENAREVHCALLAGGSVVPRICQAMQDCALSCQHTARSLRLRIRYRPSIWSLVLASVMVLSYIGVGGCTMCRITWVPERIIVT